MLKSARAIIIKKENKLLLMKRTKPNEVYYVTIGGGIEDSETSEQALLRELKEESGSIVDKPVFAFHYDDIERQNSVDFYVCKEINRTKPTGIECTKLNMSGNQYELTEISKDQINNIPLKPDAIKDKIIKIFTDQVDNTLLEPKLIKNKIIKNFEHIIVRI